MTKTSSGPATQETPAAGRLSLGLCVAGAAVSAYLTFEHYTGSSTLACSADGTLNCLAVTRSRWGVVAGVPVATAGLVFFVVMTALCSSALFGQLPWARPARLTGVALGAAAVLWLVYVELFLVNAICLWCTVVHIVTLSLLGSVLWWDSLSTRGSGRD